MEWYLTARSKRDIEEPTVRLAIKHDKAFARMEDLRDNIKDSNISSTGKRRMLKLISESREEILQTFYNRAKKEFFKKRLASSHRNA